MRADLMMQFLGGAEALGRRAASAGKQKPKLENTVIEKRADGSSRVSIGDMNGLAAFLSGDLK